jgi:hypothetical protein
MLKKGEIREAVFRAIDHVRESLVDENALPRDESAVLLGEQAALDSMGFVNFVVAVEEEMSRITGRPFYLVEKLNAPDAEAQSISTVGQFIDFLHGSVQL